MLVRRALIGLLALAAWPAAAQSTDPSFNLVNRSGQTINEIYVSPVSETNWGRDWLGADVLPNGRAFPVRIAPRAGCQQDVRVVFADGRHEERRNVNTCAIAEMVFGTAAAPAAGGTGNPSFNLVNHGRIAMREVYVSSVRDTHWGVQRLPRLMQPGEHLAVRLAENACVNDVRVIWDDGRTEDRRGVDTCRLVNMVFQ
ncbi:hypothetical protein J4558_19170 [Leptolyngbya sp. 15MV]|nr:hypothetical protein J4558_19170 [Leptolyngbya sp. 15MV]